MQDRDLIKTVPSQRQVKIQQLEFYAFIHFTVNTFTDKEWGDSTGKPYDYFYVGQLTELLTNYGDVFEIFLDGACGEGPNCKKRKYDWNRYFAAIRKWQPEACISSCGPDVRWCGNEAGETRPAEWSVVLKRISDCDRISENSQHEDSEEFRQCKIEPWYIDLDSRKMLENEQELIWYPAEVDTSIRPGWFWHESENDKVKILDDLVKIYINSVGGNCTFLLNIPPNRDMLIAESDVKRLAELGEYLKTAFADNLVPDSDLSCDSETPDREIENVTDDTYESYYMSSLTKPRLQ